MQFQTPTWCKERQPRFSCGLQYSVLSPIDFITWTMFGTPSLERDIEEKEKRKRDGGRE